MKRPRQKRCIFSVSDAELKMLNTLARLRGVTRSSLLRAFIAQEWKKRK